MARKKENRLAIVDKVNKNSGEVVLHFFYDLDFKKFKLDPECSVFGFKDIAPAFTNFDLLGSDECSFETDNLGNLTIYIDNEGSEEKEELHFKLDEKGTILVKLCKGYIPFRIAKKEISNVCLKGDDRFFAGKLFAFCLTDVDAILSFCL